MMDLYTKTSLRTSKGITKAYSTSFSLGILGLSKPLRDPIYAVYGFVRVADEIVDTFHGTNQRDLLERFWAETDRAIDEGISTNPVLHAFQYVVNAYQIDRGLINTFLRSMEMDLEDRTYDQSAYEQYILGSAEVVGLMCLKVFVNGDQLQYDALTPYAMKLGSAFQKINFLRDVAADFQSLGRTYFPNVDLAQFDDDAKMAIERDIERDFPPVFDRFYGSEAHRTCRHCGHLEPRPGRHEAQAGSLAEAPWLLLLHADARLPRGWAARLARAIGDGDGDRDGVRGGEGVGVRDGGRAPRAWYFELAIADPAPALRLVELMVRLRSRWRQRPYGDQGLLLPLALYRACGGMRPLPLMEDLDLVERLARQARLRSLQLALRVDGRRWRRRGVWETTLANLALRRAWRRGVPAAELARRYYADPADQGAYQKAQRRSWGSRSQP